MRLLHGVEWIAFAASLVPIFGVAAFLYAWMPLLTRPCHIDRGEAVANARGDVTEDQIRDCAVLGSAAEFRVSLRLATASDFTTLVYYDSVSNINLHREDDDHLSVDLGEVTWLTPQINHLGRVTISYSYSGAEPSLE
ncbi:MAG: hypothetical protein ACLQFI_11370 [Methylocella sp.]|jgi:hypothetical protein